MKPKLKPVSITITANVPSLKLLLSCVEKKAFRNKMKGHYKGEFNMAALLK